MFVGELRPRVWYTSFALNTAAVLCGPSSQLFENTRPTFPPFVFSVIQTRLAMPVAVMACSFDYPRNRSRQ